MFQFESHYARYRRRFGAEFARYFLWILPKKDGLLLSPKQNSGYLPISWRERWIFELNDHFLEVSNPRNELHSLGILLLIFAIIPVMICIWMGSLAWIDLVEQHILKTVKPDFPLPGCLFVITLFTSIFLGVLYGTKYFVWPTFIRPACFTMRRGRIRFNRDTRKVYALRPKFCGGNVVLDWDRVQAQVMWFLPEDSAVESASKKPNLEAVQKKLLFEDRSLVLYWPPFDDNDPEAKGEEALFVGPTVRGLLAGCVWEYIRLYMEEGPQAVKAPDEDKLLIRGFMDIDDCMETGRAPFKDYAEELKELNDPKAQLQVLENVVTAPLDLIPAFGLFMSQFLCYWPKFPKEWNSNSGLGID